MIVQKRCGGGFASVVAAFGLALSSGCDDDGLPNRFPVYGTVTYRGERVKQGIVNFAVAGAEGRAASGQIVDGDYTMTTLTPRDGVVPGTYDVAIIAREYDTKIATAGIEKTGGSARPQDVAKANKAARRLIPDKYSSYRTSRLKVEVKFESNRKHFELKD
jgi:hypothetical protein